MLNTALAIAPIFALIAIGFGLRRGGVPSDGFWEMNDRLVFYVLMPALFFVRISEADLSGADLWSLSAALYAGFFAAILYGFLVGRAMGRPGAQVTSILQGAARFNTFIALALAEALYGLPGLQLAVLGAAVLVPMANLVSISFFAVLVPRPGARFVRSAVQGVALNPLVIAIVLAAALNRAGLTPIPVVQETLEVLGQAALPMMLLSVGASLKLAGLRAEVWPLALATLGKMVIFPVVSVAVAVALGLPPLTAQVALIYAALPAGAVAYALARQLGGDAPLMAAMITVQTALAFVLMPVWLTLGARLFGL